MRERQIDIIFDIKCRNYVLFDINDDIITLREQLSQGNAVSSSIMYEIPLKTPDSVHDCA